MDASGVCCRYCFPRRIVELSHPIARVCSVVNLMVSWRSASMPCSSETHISPPPFMSRCQQCQTPVALKCPLNQKTAFQWTHSSGQHAMWCSLCFWRGKLTPDAQLKDWKQVRFAPQDCSDQILKNKPLFSFSLLFPHNECHKKKHTHPQA